MHGLLAETLADLEGMLARLEQNGPETPPP